MGRIKVFIKNNADFIVPIIIVAILFLVARSWLQYDVKAIDAEFLDNEEDVSSFIYEGRIYRELEQEMRKNWDDDYERIPKELLGRIKDSGVVLYAMKDSNKAFLMGETPLNEVYVYTCEGDALPSDGEVTLVYTYLGIPGMHDEGKVHLTLVKSGFEEGDLNLFQRIWEIKHNETSIDFESPYSMTHEAVICFDMYFEGCPLPGVYLYAAYQDGQWYLIDWEREYRDGQVYNYYYGYLIDDLEILEYLNTYAETYITK